MFVSARCFVLASSVSLLIWAFVSSAPLFYASTPSIEAETEDQKSTTEEKAKSPASSQLEVQSSFFNLLPIPISYKIPDLRTLILYHGTNRRPDSPADSLKILFSFRGNPTIYTARPKEILYINYDTRSGPPKWKVEQNEKGSKSLLSLSFAPQDTNCIVSVQFSLPEGQTAAIDSPHELKEFSLPITPLPTTQMEIQKWRIHNQSVDTLLLDKQGAMWYGKDMLMESLGDPDWQYQQERERVQFNNGLDAYVLWVKAGDTYIFEDDLWVPQEVGELTRGKTLLVAESVQDNAILWTLWNEDGSLHIPLQLAKKPNPLALKTGSTLPCDIKIVGTKSRNKWTSEINGIRTVIGLHDWLIFPMDSKEPIMVDSPTVLEEYIQGRIPGWLLTFQGVKRTPNDQLLTGLLFDPMRSTVTTIEISLYKSWERPKQESTSGKKESSARKPAQSSGKELLDDDDFDYEFDDDEIQQDEFDDE